MAEQIMDTINNLALVKTRSGGMSLKVKGDDGAFKTLHSTYDPEAEAKSLTDAFQFEGKGMLIVLGLGLGYHLAELSRKYPEADLVVVEAHPEIYELSKEHGPLISGDVQYLVGLSPDEALREISKLQMKEGIKPLSFFTLRSELSVFPGYYRPITEALNKAISIRLWDRLRYSKFKKDKQNVLLIDKGYFLVREAEQALRSLGHEVRSIAVPHLGKKNSRAIVPAFIEAIVDFKPDFLLTMNHLGFDEDGVLAGLFRSIELPVASWYVDSPKLIVEAFDKNVSPWMSLFLWDKSYITDMKAMGFESVEYLPLGTDETVFKPVKKIPPRPPLQKGGDSVVPLLQKGMEGDYLTKLSCDISFVGNSMVGPVNKWMEKVSADFHSIVENAAEHVARSADMHVDIMKYIPESERAKIAGLSKKEKMDLDAAVLWKATLLYRLALIERLVGFDVHIHGDIAWRELLRDRNFRLLPALNYYKELPFLYNACRINFNATSRQMSEAVNQRVFDVPACGSFLLTDHQKGLEELFDIGKEMITYKHKEEIPDLVRFYLENASAREAIAKSSRARVLKEHTYKHRLGRMIESMRQRYK